MTIQELLEELRQSKCCLYGIESGRNRWVVEFMDYEKEEYTIIALGASLSETLEKAKLKDWKP
ncbi:MAG: hypothetical protein WC748_09870 [Legionellales bacterium]|jgi:hypothetical protein